MKYWRVEIDSQYWSVDPTGEIGPLVEVAGQLVPAADPTAEPALVWAAGKWDLLWLSKDEPKDEWFKDGGFWRRGADFPASM